MVAFKHILVATDFGEPAERALDVALELARRFDAQLTLLHVVSFPAMAYVDDAYWSSEAWTGALQEANKRAKQMLDALAVKVKAQHPRSEAMLVSGHPSEQVVAAVTQRGVDLVVIGTHGRRGLPRMLLGSVAEKIIRTSPVPVLTVTASEAGAGKAPAPR